ncbi:MAG: DUF5675 family protein [Dehalococcoidales bacterium]|nr:DUF5675 family protein [Dehalococcoidales bacterium]
MEIELRRDLVQSSHKTFGKFYVDDVLACESLEPMVREVVDAPITNWRVPGDTAIPRGRYRVIINRSQRSGRDLPLILGVNGFEDVRISTDRFVRENWIFVGVDRSDVGLRNSQEAYNELFQDIRDALNSGEQVWITVG